MCSGYLNLIYSHIFQDVSGVHRCSWMFSTCSLDILWLSSRFSHDIFEKDTLLGLLGLFGWSGGLLGSGSGGSRGSFAESESGRSADEGTDGGRSEKPSTA